MQIKNLLNNRSTKLMWSEPYPGIDSDGKERTCNCDLTMSVQDAIDYTRYVYSKLGLGEELKPSSDEDLLLDFIAVNWATETTKDLPPSHSVDER